MKSQVRLSRFWLISALLGLCPLGYLAAPSQAIELRDGKSYFVSPPRLQGVESSEKVTAASNPNYCFTLELPEDAGEALQQVSIVQQDSSSNLRRLRLDGNEIRAFWGTPDDRQTALTLGTSSFDRDRQTATITFDPPVPPGSVVTIEINPERNPRQSGTYLYGVTAFPQGNNPSGQFLGYGRLQFYDRGDVFPLSALPEF